MIRVAIAEPWEMTPAYDDSSPERARFAALCAEGADGPLPVALSTQGCRICGSEDVAVSNANGDFCWDHEREGVRWD